MPRRSARNISKETQSHEEPETETDKVKAHSTVVDVIDEFVAVAEDQEGIENEEDIATSKDLPKNTEVSYKSIHTIEKIILLPHTPSNIRRPVPNLPMFMIFRIFDFLYFGHNRRSSNLKLQRRTMKRIQTQ